MPSWFLDSARNYALRGVPGSVMCSRNPVIWRRGSSVRAQWRGATVCAELLQLGYWDQKNHQVARFAFILLATPVVCCCTKSWKKKQLRLTMLCIGWGFKTRAAKKILRLLLLRKCSTQASDSNSIAKRFFFFSRKFESLCSCLLSADYGDNECYIYIFSFSG